MTDLAEDTQADKVYDDAALTYKICDYLNFISMQKEKLQYESRIHDYETFREDFKAHLSDNKNSFFNTTTHSKENNMSDVAFNANNNQNQNRDDFRSSYKVYVYSQPELKTIVPKSGQNAGKSVDVVSFRAYKRNFERTADGQFNQLEPTWMNVTHYGAAAAHLANLVKVGMALRLDGKLTSNSFIGKDGMQKNSLEFKADNVSLDLAQQGLRNIDYAKPQKEQSQTQSQNQSKPLYQQTQQYGNNVALEL